MNAAQLAQESLEKFGDYVAFHYQGRDTTNVEHWALSGRLATVLKDRGVGLGTPVLVTMPNCPDVLACFQAVWRLGAVITPITPQWGERELSYVIGHSESPVIITSPELAPKVAAAAKGVPGPRRVFVLGETDAPGAVNILPDVERAGEIRSIADRSTDDLAFLLYTSGTTGRPKGVMLTHGNIISNHKAVAAFGRLEERSSTLLVLPLSHSFGVLMMDLCYIFGASASIHARFDPAEILEAVERYRVTRFSAVPTMLVRLIHFPDREKYDTSGLEIVSSGGAILPNEVRVAFEKLYRCKVLDGYGMSECSPTATSYPAWETIRPGSTGRPVPGVTVSIQDPEGNLLPPGERGEICIKGPNVMKGYLKDEDATRKALRGGWLHSGDIGYMDQDGYVYITDRIKDLIIKGGENISPREIEEALYEHPAVAEATVLGVPDPTYGENIVAVVACKDGRVVAEAELIAHAAHYVTRFKLPARIIFRDVLPKNANGKIDRKSLREELANALQRAAS